MKHAQNRYSDSLSRSRIYRFIHVYYYKNYQQDRKLLELSCRRLEVGFKPKEMVRLLIQLKQYWA